MSPPCHSLMSDRHELFQAAMVDPSVAITRRIQAPRFAGWPQVVNPKYGVLIQNLRTCIHNISDAQHGSEVDLVTQRHRTSPKRRYLPAIGLRAILCRYVVPLRILRLGSDRYAVHFPVRFARLPDDG